MSQTSHAETAGLPRLTRKGQATRDRIVEAAAGLMFSQGVAGTTADRMLITGPQHLHAAWTSTSPTTTSIARTEPGTCRHQTAAAVSSRCRSLA